MVACESKSPLARSPPSFVLLLLPSTHKRHFTRITEPSNMSGIADTIKGVLESVGYPNKEEKLGNYEHDAAHGSGVVDHDPPSGLWDELHGEAGLRNMKAHGNIGGGHDSGLGRKAVEHQEQLAERSRLAREGKFTPHVKHDKLVNQDDEHREVAAGADTLGDLPTTEQGSVGRQADEQRLV